MTSRMVESSTAVGLPDRGLSEVGISFLKASKPAMNGGVVDRLLAKDSVDIGDCSHRRGAAAPLVERKESTLG